MVPAFTQMRELLGKDKGQSPEFALDVNACGTEADARAAASWGRFASPMQQDQRLKE